MKVSFVSSQAISSALRYQTARLQAELTNASKEMTTLRVADTGLALGARSSISASLYREIERLEGITDSNELAAARLKSTQIGLQQLTDAASELLSNFSSTLSGAGSPSIAQQQAEKVFSLMSAALNTNVNGENIFAGINTDVRPFNDFLDASSPNRVAFDIAFSTHFGFAADDPATAGITAADMSAFLVTAEADILGDAGWQNWSNATDQTISSRITLTETAQTSVTANIAAFRKLALAASTVVSSFDGAISEEARTVVLKHGIRFLSEAITDLANQQGYTGVTQQRLTQANERISMQVDLFKGSIQNLEGVDEFEAAEKVKGLQTQLEISYSLTASMQKLSLLNYLS